MNANTNRLREQLEAKGLAIKKATTPKNEEKAKQDEMEVENEKEKPPHPMRYWALVRDATTTRTLPLQL